MIDRHIEGKLLALSKSFPVVSVLGPRQAGKTTLCKKVFSDYEYCNLELPDIRDFAQEDPKAFLNKYNDKVIFDEVQRVPALLSYIQAIVDEKKSMGQFILTGSHQLQLSQEVSQSLAGRTALLNLLPLSIAELEDHGLSFEEASSYIYKGFLPRIYSDKIEPIDVYRNYYLTYVEKDVRQLINIKDQNSFEKFIKILASRVCTELNLHSISNDIGVSNTSLKNWLSVLEASHIIYILHPYYENFGKRLIKSPKIYFNDVGLLSYLLRIEKESQISRDPLMGSLFENLVVIEALKERYNQGADANLYFYNTSSGFEIDLVYKDGRSLIPIEIKSSMTYKSTFLKNLKKFKNITNSAKKAYLVYSGESLNLSEDNFAVNFKELKTIFRS